MDFLFTYKTYQDVRRNLFKYSMPFLVIAGFFTYLRILPPSHQQKVANALGYITNTPPWKDLLGAGVGIAFFIGLALVLTEIFQVHDQWYDKYVTQWRYSAASTNPSTMRRESAGFASSTVKLKVSSRPLLYEGFISPLTKQ
jgi:hypothetical protein